MTDDHSEIGSWWTPAGWLPMPKPAVMMAILTQGASLVWRDAMLASGYESVVTFGDVDHTTAIDVNIFANADHLYVEILAMDGVLAEFFVEDTYRAAFFVDKVPALLQGYGLIDHGPDSHLGAIRKTMIAFVRHGAGDRTISADGGTSLDDERQAQAERRARREREAKP